MSILIRRSRWRNASRVCHLNEVFEQRVRTDHMLPLQIRSNLGIFVRGVVTNDQLQIEFRRYLGVDKPQTQKLDPFLMAVPHLRRTCAKHSRRAKSGGGEIRRGGFELRALTNPACVNSNTRSPGRLAQLARAPARHAGGHRFKSCIAQLRKSLFFRDLRSSLAILLRPIHAEFGRKCLNSVRFRHFTESHASELFGSRWVPVKE